MDNNSNNFSYDGNLFGNSSKNFNTNTSHPLIQSSQEYMYYNKYISIHSEDRNILKYPNPAEFEIEVPEDLLNVSALRLTNWCFPDNYNTFSALNNNVTMSFSINNPYNPYINNVTDSLIRKIFDYLSSTKTQIYQIVIEDGFYTPQQMVTELTNKFNAAITNNLIEYFTENSYLTELNELNQAGGYKRFVIVYNEVSQKIWFGNICDGFILQNELQLSTNTSGDISQCATKGQLPDFSDWGLPYNLGLIRCNMSSNFQTSSTNIVTYTSNIIPYNSSIVPRFFYGDVSTNDKGYWLLPSPILTGSQVQWVESFTKVNLLGPCYIYMELHGQNCIDETSPFNVSSYTLRNSSNNGVVNSAFAKIPIRENFCIDRDLLPYKFYYPPAERMRKFYIKFRYHNGQLVNFGELNYSFVIEFTLQMPQMLRSSKSIVYPPNIHCSR